MKGLDIQISWRWQRPQESGVSRDLIKYGGLIVKYGRSIQEDFCGMKLKSVSGIRRSSTSHCVFFYLNFIKIIFNYPLMKHRYISFVKSKSLPIDQCRDISRFPLAVCQLACGIIRSSRQLQKTSTEKLVITVFFSSEHPDALNHYPAILHSGRKNVFFENSLADCLFVKRSD